MGRTSKLGPSLIFFWGGKKEREWNGKYSGEGFRGKVGMKFVECTVSAVI